MISFIEEHRETYGVEPVRRVLQIAPSTYHAHADVARDPGKASDRSKRDAETLKTIRSVHDKGTGRYGARKAWRQLSRTEGGRARCAVERLMRKQGLQGVSRGRKKTTIPGAALPRDKVRRKFKAAAPDRLRVADFTYVHTAMGTAYATFVIDALNQAICQRCKAMGSLTRHSAAACNMCPSDTPSGLPKPESTCPSGASETAATTHLPKPSSDCSRPKSSSISARGKPKAGSNGKP